MCEKIISKGSAREIDPCLIDELEEIKNTVPRFKEKYKDLMSCCGHGKYSKTFVVMNRASGFVFDWFSGIALTRSKRRDSRAPYYVRDAEGHYFIPEVEDAKKQEFNLYSYRKFEDEDPLRAWFYTEIITRMFMKSLKKYFEKIEFDPSVLYDRN